MTAVAVAAFMLPGDLPPAVPLFPAWYDEAACYGVDLAAFFPGKGQPLSVMAEARALCNVCPVKAECLQLAIDEDLVGVWGGTTTSQRRKMQARSASHSPTH